MKKLLVLIFLLPFTLFAQTKKEVKNAERRIRALANYLEIEPHKDTLNNWAQWVSIGESPSADNAKRVEAWSNFLLSLFDNLGTIPNSMVNKPALQGWTNFLTSNIMPGRVMDLKNQADRLTSNELGNVKVIGNGPETIVLLAPVGFGWEVYEDIIEQYQDRFRFVGITFPGSHNVPGYALPTKRNPSNPVWLNLVEQNVLNTLKEEGIDDFYILSMGISTYTAVKIGLSIPDRVKGIININGAFTSWLASPDNPEVRASMSYRQNFYQRSYPTAELIQLTPTVFNNYMDFSKDASKNQSYMAQLTTDQIPNTFRYLLEYNSQDLTHTINNLSVPMLNMISMHDSRSAKASGRGLHRFWQEMKSDLAELPSQTVFIPDARDALYLDQPGLFSFYFEAFLDDPRSQIRQITDNKVISVLPQPSPAASISQAFGQVEVSIDYHRPSVNKRKVFGELIPYGQVWRAGANEATRVHFSSDVEILGQKIQEGTYGLFVIPDKNEWTVIFNGVSEQWGAFNYRSQYDVARIRVKPEQTGFTEMLKYDFDNHSGESVELVLSWEETKIRLKISEAFELPKPPAKIMAYNWTKILEDKSADGVNPGLTDGKALSYYLDHANDMLWFKFDLYEKLNPNAFAMNILIDTDANQETGMNWFGTNKGFTFEKCLTLWMRREGKSYGGTNGITDQSGIYSNNWNRLKQNNLTYYLDDKNLTYTVGVSLRDLDIDGKQVHLIGAVGEYMTWNDDIGDTESATITLKK